MTSTPEHARDADGRSRAAGEPAKGAHGLVPRATAVEGLWTRAGGPAQTPPMGAPVVARPAGPSRSARSFEQVRAAAEHARRATPDQAGQHHAGQGPAGQGPGGQGPAGQGPAAQGPAGREQGADLTRSGGGGVLAAALASRSGAAWSLAGRSGAGRDRSGDVPAPGTYPMPPPDSLLVTAAQLPPAVAESLVAPVAPPADPAVHPAGGAGSVPGWAGPDLANGAVRATTDGASDALGPDGGTPVPIAPSPSAPSPPAPSPSASPPSASPPSAPSPSASPPQVSPPQVSPAPASPQASPAQPATLARPAPAVPPPTPAATARVDRARAAGGRRYLGRRNEPAAPPAPPASSGPYASTVPFVTSSDIPLGPAGGGSAPIDPQAAPAGPPAAQPTPAMPPWLVDDAQPAGFSAILQDTAETVLLRPIPEDEGHVDGPAASLVRPYSRTGGRTKPGRALDLEALVGTTVNGREAWSSPLLSPEHVQVISLCVDTTSVAEIAARLAVPIGVARVIIADMVDLGLVEVGRTSASYGDERDPAFLRRVLSGLQRL